MSKIYRGIKVITEKNYVRRICSHLERYKEISHNPFSVNFRCPICGDSKKRKNKTRAYIYEKKNSLHYNCFNCGSNFPFWKFLRDYHSNIFMEYKLEWMKTKYGNKDCSEPQDTIFKTVTKFDHSNFKLGTKISDIDDDIILSYIKMRKIPEKYWNSIYACSDINIITKQIEKYKDIKFTPEPVIVIPLYNENRDYSYICIRTISNDSYFRYMVLQVDDSYSKIWGLEFIDFTKPIFIVEGPIDAMSIDNCLALMGTAKNQVIYLLEKVNNISNIIFIFDNELHSNKEVRKIVERTVAEGYSVVLFDKNFKFKDINESIVNGWTKEQVQDYLNSRVFSGIRAKLEMAQLLKYYNR